MKKLKIPKIGYMIAFDFKDGYSTLVDMVEFEKPSKKDLKVSKENKKKGVKKIRLIKLAITVIG